MSYMNDFRGCDYQDQDDRIQPFNNYGYETIERHNDRRNYGRPPYRDRSPIRRGERGPYRNRGDFRQAGYIRSFGDGRNRDRSFANENFGGPEIMTKSLLIENKKFFIDVKENKKGKFVRISEVVPNAPKVRIVFSLAETPEFHEKLTEICEFYANLSPERQHRGYEKERTLKSESVYTPTRRFYLDLKENHRGRLLKLASMAPTMPRSCIAIPASGIVEVRDVLTDVLNQFGQEKIELEKCDESKANIIEMDNKKFGIDFGSNSRCTYMRITEQCGTFDTSITVDKASWDEFIMMAEEAIKKTENGEEEEGAKDEPVDDGEAAAGGGEQEDVTFSGEVTEQLDDELTINEDVTEYTSIDPHAEITTTAN